MKNFNLTIAAVGLLFVACQTPTATSSGICNASLDCDQGQVCSSGDCVFLCTNDAQCGVATSCQGGLCLQSAGGDGQTVVDPCGADRDFTAACGADGLDTNGCQCDPDAVCGDGIVDLGEACDDGNQDNTDACLNIDGACVAARCGDGFVQANVEPCDDGNQDNTDACLNLDGVCQVAQCGDGIQQVGVDECDDGNQDNADACVNDNGECKNAFCGDGFVRVGVEQCDGPVDPTAVLNANCLGCMLSCVPGSFDCDGDPTNGCESDLTESENCGGCGRSCMGDACGSDFQCEVADVATIQGNFVSSIQFKSYEDNLYWYENGNLHAVEKSGSQAQIVLAAITELYDITNDQVYYVDQLTPSGSAIRRINLDGTGLTTIMANTNTPTPGTFASHFAVTDNRLYWIYGPAGATAGGVPILEVWRANLEGGQSSLVGSYNSYYTTPRSFIFQNDRVWFGSVGNFGTGGMDPNGVFSVVNPDGVSATLSPAILSDSSPEFIASEGNEVIWFDSVIAGPSTTPRLYTSSITVPIPTPIEDNINVKGIQMRPDYAYVLIEDPADEDGVYRYDRATGVIEPFRTGASATAYSLVQDDTHLFWAVQDAASSSTYTIKRLRIF